MVDYQIDANTRRCAATGEELPAGAKYYAALFEEHGKFIRRDYSGAAWQGPPHGAFSFWSGTVPPPNATQRLPIDDDLLMECFERLEGQTDPDRIRFRYVVALLLMRRKRLKFEEARTVGDDEILVLKCARTRNTFEAINPRMTDEDMATVQEEVLHALGWN